MDERMKDDLSMSDMDNTSVVMANVIAHTPPRLWITSHGCVSQERFGKNGIQKQVHVVVKNLMFVVQVEANVDITKANLEAKLLYDFNHEKDPQVEVSFVKNEPLDYKVNLRPDAVNKAALELKIKVLTSQHEDMLFRVKLLGVDPATGILFDTVTQPVKVISKLIQLKKKGSPTVTTPSPTKKRSSSTDSVSSSLARIEEQLAFLMDKISPGHNQESLATLSNVVVSATNDGSDEEVAVGKTVTHEMNLQPSLEDDEEKEDQFELRFKQFVTSFLGLDPQQRHRKIGDIFNNPSYSQHLDEFLSAFDSPTRKKLKTKDDK